MGESLTAKTLRGFSWTTLGTVVNAFMQIVLTAVLARLLSPADFGLVAMATLVMRIGLYFSQMGLTVAIVQKPNLSAEEIRAAFTISAGTGVLFYLLSWCIAPIAGGLFRNAEVVPIIRTMGLVFVLLGMQTPISSVLRRRMAFRLLALTDVASYVLGYGLVGGVLAYSGWGAWSLVIGTLAQRSLALLITLIFGKVPIGFRFDLTSFRPLLTVGGWVSSIGFLEFLSGNLDTLLVGTFMTATLLGIYNRAFNLVQLPLQYFTSSLTTVLLSSFSSLQRERERLKYAYARTFFVLGIVLTSVCFGMIAGADAIVLTILGPKWSMAIPIFRIFAVGTPLTFLASLGGVMCEAVANLRAKLVLQIASVALFAGALFGLSHYGLVGFAVAVVVGETVRFLGYLYLMRDVLGMTWDDYQPVAGGVFWIAGGVTLAIYLVSQITRSAGSPPWLSLIAEVCAGGIALSGMVLSNTAGVLSYLGPNFWGIVSEKVVFLQRLGRGTKQRKAG